MSDNLPVAIDQSGVLKPQNLNEAIKFAEIAIKSKMLPARFETPESVLIASQYALELGLRPLTAMKNIAVVKGTPCLFGDLPLALCQGSGKLEYIREFYLDPTGLEISVANKNIKQPAFGAFCTVKRKGDPHPHETFFTMDDAQNAGLVNSPTWKAYPKRMLRYRARSQALKDKFADCLNGIGIAEYDHNILPDDIERPESDPRQGATAYAPPASGYQAGDELPMTLREKLARKAQYDVLEAEAQ